jgi:ABC-type microcin C transport system permease subunit YejE
MAFVLHTAMHCPHLIHIDVLSAMKCTSFSAYNPMVLQGQTSIHFWHLLHIAEFTVLSILISIIVFVNSYPGFL